MNNKILKNVRLSFPSLFQKAKFEGVETNYGATFILDKKEHADLIKELMAEIKQIMRDTGKKVGKDRWPVKDGDEKTDADGNPIKEYEGKVTVRASNRNKIKVLNRDKSEITEEDEIIYPGCYVNAAINMWMSRHGRICATVLAIQFAADGDNLGKPRFDVDEFEDLGEPKKTGFDLASGDDEDDLGL